MSGGVLTLAIDPAPEAGAPVRPLFPSSGEFAAALRTLAPLRAEHRVADEVLLHLYAYELAERVREAASAGGGRLAAPLWPASAFAAAGIAVNAGRELERLLPPELVVTAAPVAAAAARAAAVQCLGPVSFDGAAYVRHLAASAATWPERRTAAFLLVRNGRVLLERRPEDARVTPGVWDVPGGHIGAEESPLEALARELAEELGISEFAARLFDVADRAEPPRSVRYRHFTYAIESFASEPAAREGQQLAWFTPAELLALAPLNPPVRELVQRASAAR